MRIGIIDYDMYVKPSVKRLNVEAMKLGTYYEKKGFSVEILSPEDIIFNYDKIIVVSTMNFQGKNKDDLLKHPNIDLIGPGFNNGDYIPFENDEINYAQPQFKFYNHLLKYCYKKKIYNKQDIEKLSTTTYVRIFPNTKPINIDKILTGERIYIVDNYIYNYPNWEETIKYLAIYNRYFAFVFPQMIKNKEDLIKFSQLKRYNFINAIGNIRIESLDELTKAIKETNVLQEISPSSFLWELAYSQTNNYNETFYQKEFYNTLKKVEITNKNNIMIVKAAYENHSAFIFTNKIFKVLRQWVEYNKNTKYSFNEYIFLLIKQSYLISLYLKFINKHEEYKPLINKIYNKIGGN